MITDRTLYIIKYLILLIKCYIDIRLVLFIGLNVSGTIWTAFKPQMERLDTDKLTLVTWEAPGYGKSRPPDRDFPDDFYERDAAWAHNLMKLLSYDKFSLIGWSAGGTTSMFIAANYPESIQKMVLLCAYATISPYEEKMFEGTILHLTFSWDI